MTGFADQARTAAQVATGMLGWSPEQFWGATPAELLTALAGRFGDVAGGAVNPLPTNGLQQLRERFPDGR